MRTDAIVLLGLLGLSLALFTVGMIRLVRRIRIGDHEFLDRLFCGNVTAKSIDRDRSAVR